MGIRKHSRTSFKALSLYSTLSVRLSVCKDQKGRRSLLLMAAVPPSCLVHAGQGKTEDRAAFSKRNRLAFDWCQRKILYVQFFPDFER
jgi:hypothetical protein